MAESFPVDGTGGFTTSDFSAYFASSDGPMEDYTGDALSYTRSDGANLFQLVAGTRDAYVSIDGYRLRIPAGTTEDLVVPTVPSGTVTYYVIGYYDPLLNVRNSDQSAPRPAGACRFGVYASTDVSAAMAGKSYVLLYSFPRAAGQALSATTVTSWLRWRGGPTVEYPESMATPPVGSADAPRGTLRYSYGTNARKLYARTATNATTLGWVDLLNSAAIAFPAPSTLVANSSAPMYRIVAGVMVKCSGTLKRSNGQALSSGSDTTLGTFPVGLRPASTERYLCKTGAGKNYIEVRVNSTDGTVVMTGESGVDWIDISPLFFYIGS